MGVKNTNLFTEAKLKEAWDQFEKSVGKEEANRILKEASKILEQAFQLKQQGHFFQGIDLDCFQDEVVDDNSKTKK